MPSRASANAPEGLASSSFRRDGTGEQLAVFVFFLLLLFGFGFGFPDFFDEIELLFAEGFEFGF